MAQYSILLGAPTALLLLLSVMFVKGVPLRDHRLSTTVDDVARRIFNETENELFSGVIDRHLVCRACKRLIINGRFAMIVEKTAISEYFTDPCNDFFTDHTDRHDCTLVIQQKWTKCINTFSTF
ncbi:uncharacterized protein LOC105446570 [Strongylocentrotus purpuratus]|uniref:Uncharacterized protein n=1 Tax=Strongylocentrotus purpuratus TaxID=7668 RepID=A0A7M7HJD0_STRPU|nr:uncharacterized protein LOC105446570 [Strongylocentrotus purpuratus]